jgi:uncharacterized protein YaaR (DUF327 family)
MESRFDKYTNNNSKTASHIANINNFIDYLYSTGNDTIEEEIKDLQSRINAGGAPAIFSSKVNELLALGRCIEKVYATYHFNKSN